jgi:hypothetical protein
MAADGDPVPFLPARLPKDVHYLQAAPPCGCGYPDAGPHLPVCPARTRDRGPLRGRRLAG